MESAAEEKKRKADKYKGQPLAAITFYKYLYRKDKKLLFRSVFFSYLLPVILELLPWYMSRNKLLIRIRKAKVSITYDVQTKNRLKKRLMGKFVAMAVLYSAIDTTVRYWRRRVRKEHKFAMRRLVMEKMLYAEVEAFEAVKPKITKKLLSQLSQSLDLFDTTIPALIGTVYTLYLEGRELFRHRSRLDPLTVVYPVGLAIARRIFTDVREMVLPSPKEMAKKEKIEKKWFSLVHTVSEGLTDIQVNNLQASQLQRVDHLSNRAIISSKGFSNFFDQFYDYVSPKSIFEFVGESYVVHTIMQRKGIAFNKHMVVQQDVEQCLRAGKRVATLWQTATDALLVQRKVSRLLGISGWEKELLEGGVYFSEFRELRMTNVRFSYAQTPAHAPPAIDMKGEEVILRPRQKYAIVGPNEAGKSTLGKLLLKIYKPQGGGIWLNGVHYDKIPRHVVRQSIAYVSQRPFLFDGTIRDNIKIGNPHADDELALAAGILSCRVDEVPVSDRRDSFTHKRSKSVGSGLHRAMQRSVSGQEFASHRLRGSANAWLPTNVKAKSDEEQVQQILDMQVTEKGQNLSGGLLQSVALARVFVHTTAKIIILDEVIREMDVQKRNIVFPLLCEYLDSHGMTLVLITHDVGLMAEMDEVIVMQADGSIACRGTHDQLIEDGVQEYLDML